MSTADTELTGFGEFHGELRAVAGELLAKNPVVDWPVLAETGWTGLEIGEQYGGAGATFTEVAIVCEEIGRAAAATSYLGAAVLAAGALNLLSPSTVRDALLSGIASGESRPALVFDGFTLCDGVLDGTAPFVSDAEGADRLLVLAQQPDSEPALLVLDPGAAGVRVTAQPVLDETRRLATVTVEQLAVAEDSEAAAVLRFAGDPAGAVRQLCDRAAVAVACDSLGAAEAMLAATVDYVQVRHQFDRPIGSFQAVKHACADMKVALAVSRQLVDTAVAALTQDPANASIAASMAKAHATASAVEIVGKALQLHGGIGYTWESGIHVYLKRAALNRSLFGSPAAHRQRLSRRYTSST